MKTLRQMTDWHDWWIVHRIHDLGDAIGIGATLPEWSDWTMWLNNLSSIVLIVACWLLAHQYRFMHRNRYMSYLYAGLGLLLLGSMMLRIGGHPSIWAGILIKLFAAYIFIYVYRFIRQRFHIG